jgi:hypothetical protein
MIMRVRHEPYQITAVYGAGIRGLGELVKIGNIWENR